MYEQSSPVNNATLRRHKTKLVRLCAETILSLQDSKHLFFLYFHWGGGGSWWDRSIYLISAPWISECTRSISPDDLQRICGAPNRELWEVEQGSWLVPISPYYNLIHNKCKPLKTIFTLPHLLWDSTGKNPRSQVRYETGYTWHPLQLLREYERVRV